MHQLRYLLILSIAVVCGPALHEVQAADPKADKKATPAEAAAPTEAPAELEFVCESDIFYSWERKPEPSPAPLPGAAKATAPKTPEEEIKPVETFFSRISEHDSNEDAAKEKLTRRMSAAQAEAIRACQAEHHNRSRCVGQRLTAASDEYAFADYSTRKALLDAITEDCANAAGRCIGTRSGEISCYKSEVKKATTAEGAAVEAGAPPPAKETKGKKK